jgi:nitroreductase
MGRPTRSEAGDGRLRPGAASSIAAAMDVFETMRTTGTCRFFRKDPVPDDVLRRVLDAARYAPTGGNRQGVRFVVVRDQSKRRALADLYLPLWQQYASRAVVRPGAPLPKMLENADHMARHLHEVPVHIVVCAQVADLMATDRHLDRISVVAGASIYPSVQNLLLAARAEGLGTALTTLLCAVEPKVKELLAIPDYAATAALIPLGYPQLEFPKKLARRPLSEIVFGDTYNEPLFAAPPSP